MIELSGTVYLWIKALHVISVIAWMAGLLYLPRLFVYHADAEPGSEKSETFKIMERRLMKAIMNPAMHAAWFFGLLMLASWDSDDYLQGWLLVKFGCVVLMSVVHAFMGSWRRAFEADRNTRSAKFFRIANEVPTVFLIIVVIMVIVRPF